MDSAAAPPLELAARAAPEVRGLAGHLQAEPAPAVRWSREQAPAARLVGAVARAESPAETLRAHRGPAHESGRPGILPPSTQWSGLSLAVDRSASRSESAGSARSHRRPSAEPASGRSGYAFDELDAASAEDAPVAFDAFPTQESIGSLETGLSQASVASLARSVVDNIFKKRQRMDVALGVALGPALGALTRRHSQRREAARKDNADRAQQEHVQRHRFEALQSRAALKLRLQREYLQRQQLVRRTRWKTFKILREQRKAEAEEVRDAYLDQVLAHREARRRREEAAALVGDSPRSTVDLNEWATPDEIATVDDDESVDPHAELVLRPSQERVRRPPPTLVLPPEITAPDAVDPWEAASLPDPAFLHSSLLGGGGGEIPSPPRTGFLPHDVSRAHSPLRSASPPRDVRVAYIAPIFDGQPQPQPAHPSPSASPHPATTSPRLRRGSPQAATPTPLPGRGGSPRHAAHEHRPTLVSDGSAYSSAGSDLVRNPAAGAWSPTSASQIGSFASASDLAAAVSRPSIGFADYEQTSSSFPDAASPLPLATEQNPPARSRSPVPSHVVPRRQSEFARRERRGLPPSRRPPTHREPSSVVPGPGNVSSVPKNRAFDDLYLRDVDAFFEHKRAEVRPAEVRSKGAPVPSPARVLTAPDAFAPPFLAKAEADLVRPVMTQSRLARERLAAGSGGRSAEESSIEEGMLHVHAESSALESSTASLIVHTPLAETPRRLPPLQVDGALTPLDFAATSRSRTRTPLQSATPEHGGFRPPRLRTPLRRPVAVPPLEPSPGPSSASRPSQHPHLTSASPTRAQPGARTLALAIVGDAGAAGEPLPLAPTKALKPRPSPARAGPREARHIAGMTLSARAADRVFEDAVERGFETGLVAPLSGATVRLAELAWDAKERTSGPTSTCADE